MALVYGLGFCNPSSFGCYPGGAVVWWCRGVVARGVVVWGCDGVVMSWCGGAVGWWCRVVVRWCAGMASLRLKDASLHQQRCQLFPSLAMKHCNQVLSQIQPKQNVTSL